jgi:hypothetical protein
MTDAEIQQFIKTVFYTYDRALVPKELQEYAKAWGPYVREFDYNLAQQLLPNICLGREFPPRPWEIRVALINYANKITPPPTAQQAWAQYQQIVADINNGTSPNIRVHEVLAATMAALGSVGMNSNFDAKRFESLYETKANEWLKATYAVGMDNSKGQKQ